MWNIYFFLKFYIFVLYITGQTLYELFGDLKFYINTKWILELMNVIFSEFYLKWLKGVK